MTPFPWWKALRARSLSSNRDSSSPIALSTSLAEHLASHGYVVVALQTDMTTENELGDKPIAAIDPARIALLHSSFEFIASAAFENLVGPVNPNRIGVVATPMPARRLSISVSTNPESRPCSTSTVPSKVRHPPKP